MALPIRVIDGKDLVERWGMSTSECFCVTLNHGIDPAGKFVGLWEWERIGWDIVIEGAKESKKKISFSEQVFFLSDITEFEERHDCLLDEEKRKVLSIEQLTKRWGLGELNVEDILDNYAAVKVDPVGFPLKEELFTFLLMEQEMSTVKFWYRLDDIENIEEKHPELNAITQQREIDKAGVNLPVGEAGSASPNQATEKITVPMMSFYKNGQIWRIGEQGKEKDFKDLGGFRFIQFLLRYEGEVFDPIKVYYCGNVPDEIRNDLYKTDFQRHLDPDAVKSIAGYKKEMEEQLIETSDEETIRELDHKIGQCETVLKDAKKGFRKYQNCRSNVQKHIKKVIKAIERQSRDFPSLKPILKYLCLDNPKKTIKTGNFIWYRHDPSDPVNWLLDPPNP